MNEKKKEEKKQELQKGGAPPAPAWDRFELMPESGFFKETEVWSFTNAPLSRWRGRIGRPVVVCLPFPGHFFRRHSFAWCCRG